MHDRSTEGVWDASEYSVLQPTLTSTAQYPVQLPDQQLKILRLWQAIVGRRLSAAAAVDTELEVLDPHR